MKISFIGLGNMGKPLAERILGAGNSLAIWTSKPETAAHFEKLGAAVAGDKAELADCEALFSCVPRPEDVERLALGEGLYARMRPGAVHVDISTIDPDTAERLERAAAEKGLGYVQATVSKTPQVAASGNAPFFVGGRPEAVARVFPVLEAMGKPSKVGGVREACVIKILSNQMLMAILGVVAEGFRVGALAGLDLKEFLRLLQSSGASSFQLDARGPLITEGDYAPRFSVDLALKDLRLGERMLKSLGYAPALISQAKEYMERAAESGHRGEDMCAIYKILEE